MKALVRLEIKDEEDSKNILVALIRNGYPVHTIINVNSRYIVIGEKDSVNFKQSFFHNNQKPISDLGDDAFS